jgi:hypothetical protein
MMEQDLTELIHEVRRKEEDKKLPTSASTETNTVCVILGTTKDANPQRMRLEIRHACTVHACSKGVHGTAWYGDVGCKSGLEKK